MATLGRSSTVLVKTTLMRSEYERMRKELLVTPASGMQGFMPSFRVYEDRGHELCVPRHYYKGPVVPEWEPECFETMDRLVFHGHLKDSLRQPEAVQATLDACRTIGGGILSLPTGYGKTTVGLFVACKLGHKTLVLTHKEFLMDQWIERIRHFIPEARIGRIQQSTCDVSNKDIVVGMMQSICSKDYGPEAFRGFGTLLIDEAHHVSAPVFLKCMYRSNCPYVVGLSATPYRKDGLSYVIEWFLGPIFFRIERENQAHVGIKVLSYDCPEYGLPPPTMARTGNINMAEVITRVSEDRTRNDILIQHVLELVREGRKVMVLSERRNHCMVLYEKLRPHAGLYIGGMKQGDLKESEACQVIVATYSQANEGLDIPTLDTMVFATPKSDVIQAVGRILREGSNIVKHQSPLVIDILDKYGVFYAQFCKRRKYYDRAGFVINHPKDSGAKFSFIGDSFDS